MKKLYTFLLSAFIMAAGMTMFACGDDQPKSYNITIEENSLVDINTDYQLAQEGTLITVTVEPEIDVYVLNVYANEEPCTKVDDSTYTFTIVADTVVSVETEMRYTEVNESEYASASVLNPSQIIKIDDGYMQGWRPYLTYNFSESIMNEASGGNLITLTSSNQTVIPDEALSAEFFNSEDRDNGYVDGIDVYINTDMIDYGEAFIIIEVKEIQVSSSPTCRLVKKIEVVHEEDYDYTANLMTEAVTLDFSSVETLIDNFDYIGVHLLNDDNARVYGIDYSKLGISLADIEPFKTEWMTAGVLYYIAREDLPTELTLNLGYLAGHHFGLDVFGLMSDNFDDYNERIYLTINERWTNGAMYSGGALTFENDNSTLTLDVVSR